MRSEFRFTTSRGGENSTGTMGIFASALTIQLPLRYLVLIQGHKKQGFWVAVGTPVT